MNGTAKDTVNKYKNRINRQDEDMTILRENVTQKLNFIDKH
jgi:hypothetical protein